MRFESPEELMERENSAHFEQQAEAQRHRELDLKEALEECHAKGISTEAMQTLIFETGFAGRIK